MASAYVNPRAHIVPHDPMTCGLLSKYEYSGRVAPFRKMCCPVQETVATLKDVKLQDLFNEYINNRYCEYCFYEHLYCATVKYRKEKGLKIYADEKDVRLDERMLALAIMTDEKDIKKMEIEMKKSSEKMLRDQQRIKEKMAIEEVKHKSKLELAESKIKEKLAIEELRIKEKMAIEEAKLKVKLEAEENRISHIAIQRDAIINKKQNNNT